MASDDRKHTFNHQQTRVMTRDWRVAPALCGTSWSAMNRRYPSFVVQRRTRRRKSAETERLLFSTSNMFEEGVHNEKQMMAIERLQHLPCLTRCQCSPSEKKAQAVQCANGALFCCAGLQWRSAIAVQRNKTVLAEETLSLSRWSMCDANSPCGR